MAYRVFQTIVAAAVTACCWLARARGDEALS
jgi:hypothetical protein